MPCDTTALLHSAELPPSIYDNGEQLFDLKERDQLVKELTIGLQPGWDPQPYEWHYGIENSLIRYNRVDALDAGVQVSRDFGSGYTGSFEARVSGRTISLGRGTLQPKAEWIPYLRRGTL